MIDMEIVLGRENFEKRFGELYAALFQGSDVARQSFCRDTWQFALTTDGFEWNHRGEFDALCRAAQSVGDHQMVWTNLEFDAPRTVTCILPLDYSAYVRAFREKAELAGLYAGSKAIFGLSGSWGCLVEEAGRSFSGGFMIVGGTAAFIDKFALHWGGFAQMRTDFINYLSDPHLSATPALRDRLLGDVGWLAD